MNGWIMKFMDGWMDVRMDDRWIMEFVNGWRVDGFHGRWMDGWNHVSFLQSEDVVFS